VIPPPPDQACRRAGRNSKGSWVTSCSHFICDDDEANIPSRRASPPAACVFFCFVSVLRSTIEQYDVCDVDGHMQRQAG
jgi:hypothetical protein